MNLSRWLQPGMGTHQFSGSYFYLGDAFVDLAYLPKLWVGAKALLVSPSASRALSCCCFFNDDFWFDFTLIGSDWTWSDEMG